MGRLVNRPYNKRTENMKILCPFFTRLAPQGIVCYTFLYCRAKVSLLLWEKGDRDSGG